MSSWASILSTSSAPLTSASTTTNVGAHAFKSVPVIGSSDKNSKKPSATTNVNSTTQPSKVSKVPSSSTVDSKIERKFSGQKVSHSNDLNDGNVSNPSKNSASSSNGTSSVHNNGFDYSGWKTQQYTLKKQLISRDHKLSFDPKNLEKTLKFIGGVDISFDKENTNRAVASLIVLSFPDLKIAHEEHAQVEMTLPYIAGYLGFREVPHIQKLVENVRNKLPHFMPQIILVDGNGRLHQRGFGSACHLGVLEDIPTIGVAKKILMVKGLTDEYVDGLEQQLTKKGDCIDIDIDKEPRIGAILKTDSTTNVYISPGHRVCLDTAIDIVKRCSLKDIPEPIYQADFISRKLVKKYFKKQNVGKNSRR